MIIEEPIKNTYTVYYIDNDINSQKMIRLLKNYVIPPLFINCTKYIQENKYEFFYFIENYIHFSFKMMPIVFFNKKFLGSYREAYVIYNRQHESEYNVSLMKRSLLCCSLPIPKFLILYSNKNSTGYLSFPYINHSNHLI